MGHVTIRDLRNRGGEVVDRVQDGERVVITRSGKPVAELRALRPEAMTAEALLRRWSRLPTLDGASLRRDLDQVVDPNL